MFLSMLKPPTETVQFSPAEIALQDLPISLLNLLYCMQNFGSIFPEFRELHEFSLHRFFWICRICLSQLLLSLLVNLLHMDTQGTQFPEAAGAFFARELLAFAAVEPFQVALQIGLLDETEGAFRALMGPITRVDDSVDFQRALLGESLSANLTAERFLPRVDQ